MNPQRSYASADGVRWVVDADATRVVDDGGGRSWQLVGVEATVWQWLALGHDAHRMVQLLATLEDQSHADAATTLANTLERWTKQGLVVRLG